MVFEGQEQLKIKKIHVEKFIIIYDFVTRIVVFELSFDVTQFYLFQCPLLYLLVYLIVSHYFTCFHACSVLKLMQPRKSDGAAM